MSQIQTRKREYETIYVLRPSVQQSASAALAGRVNELLGRNGGTLTRVENWGRRKLAYPVQKQNYGVYVYIKYAGVGQVVPELERALRLSDDVMKYQTVKLRDLHQEPEVDPNEVVFEHYDAQNAPPEEEESYAKQLGLEDRAGSFRATEDSMDDEDGDDSSDSDESDGDLEIGGRAADREET